MSEVVEKIAPTTEFVKAGSIEVPDCMFQPIPTGYPEVDAALSAIKGAVPSQVVLMTGPPGTGKTTLALMASVGMTLETKNPGAFVSLEMAEWQVKLTAKKMPGFELLNISKSVGMKDNLFETLRKMKPSVVIIDSIQKWAGMDGEKTGWTKGFNTNQKDIVDACVHFAKETMIPMILIGHCTKGGQYIGPSHLEHEVDTHIHVKFDKEIEMRTFETGTKNRFGGITDEYIFGIENESVWIGTPYEPGIARKVIKKLVDPAEKEEVIEMIRQFRIKHAGSQSLALSYTKPFLDKMADWFQTEEAQWIEDETPLRGPLTSEHGAKFNHIADCHRGSGTIRWGRKVNMKDFRIGKVGYGREQKFIIDWCKDPIDLLVWVFLHEAYHLKHGEDKHTVAFFKGVETLALRHKDLFSKYNPTI